MTTTKSINDSIVRQQKNDENWKTEYPDIIMWQNIFHNRYSINRMSQAFFADMYTRNPDQWAHLIPAFEKDRQESEEWFKEAQAALRQEWDRRDPAKHWYCKGIWRYGFKAVLAVLSCMNPYASLAIQAGEWLHLPDRVKDILEQQQSEIEPRKE